jgi:hypothetical protein
MTNKDLDHLPIYGYLIICVFLMLFSLPVLAEWDIVTHTNIDSDVQTKVAHTENSEGYSLEIYRDANKVIRARFSMLNNLNRLDGKNCPTYQVDKRKPENTSINDAPCIAHRKWGEFILGYISGEEVTSTFLHNIMNGSKITFRFILENSGYTETAFSLLGSKRTLTEALGSNLKVLTDSGFSN